MKFRQFLAIVEIRTKIVSLSTFTLASLYVVLRTGRLDPLKTTLMFIATLLVDMGTTAFNTYFDFRRGVDSAAFNREESKVVVHEDVPWGYALLISVGLFLLAAPFGIALAVLSGWPVLVAGVLCMAVGYFYTGGPFPISRTPFGEVFAGGFLGGVLFLLVFFIHAGWPDLSTLVAALPSTLMVAAILTVNNTCDIQGDSAAGRRTLSIVLGRTGGEALAIGEVGAGWLILGILSLFEPFPRWSWITILPFVILSAREFVLMHRRGYSHETKGPSMGSISRIFLLFSAAMVIVLAVAIVKDIR